MQPADQILVQKHLSAVLAKAAAMQKNLMEAKTTLKQQEQALYEITKEAAASVAPVSLPAPRSPSILDADVDMTDINNAIKRLSKGCNCPNIDGTNLPGNTEEGV